MSPRLIASNHPSIRAHYCPNCGSRLYEPDLFGDRWCPACLRNIKAAPEPIREPDEVEAMGQGITNTYLADLR